MHVRLELDEADLKALEGDLAALQTVVEQLQKQRDDKTRTTPMTIPRDPCPPFRFVTFKLDPF